MSVVPVDKRSVSLDADLAAAIEQAAAAEGVSFSQFLAAAAADRLRRADGLRAVAEWEAEHGAFTAEEIAEADAEIAQIIERQRAREHRR